jgi:hypothetical protein
MLGHYFPRRRQMESLSKEKNLILGLLLGMALAIAIPYAQPSELRASAEATVVTEGGVRRAIGWCLNDARITGYAEPISENPEFRGYTKIDLVVSTTSQPQCRSSR